MLTRAAIREYVFFILIFALFSTNLYGTEDKIKYKINTSITYQTIDNFSASDAWRMAFIGKNWPLHKKNQIADLLFSRDFDYDGNPVGMGLSNWRVNIGAGSYENREYKEVQSTWNRTECFMSPDGTYDFNKQLGQQWFMNAARERDMNDFLFFSNSSPYFMTRSASTLSPDMDYINLQEDKFEDFAAFLTTCAKHFIDKGFNVKYISPINEPNVNWSTNDFQEGSFATKADIYKVVCELDKSISRKSINSKIIIPEVGNLKYLFEVDTLSKTPDNIIKDFFTSQGSFNVMNLENLYKCVAAHDYWTAYPPELLVDIRRKVQAKLSAIDDVKLWASEYCILEENDEISGTSSDTKSINLGLYTARIMHSDLAIANASAWQWWTAVSLGEDVPIQLKPLKGSTPETVKYDGIISPTKMLWTTANYSFFIRPGMHRVDIQPTNMDVSDLDAATSLMASSYTDGKDVITVFINYGVVEKKVQIDCGSSKIGKLYITSIDKDLEYIGEYKLDSIIIPAKSVVTVVF